VGQTTYFAIGYFAHIQDALNRFIVGDIQPSVSRYLPEIAAVAFLKSTPNLDYSYDAQNDPAHNVMCGVNNAGELALKISG
jgi:hypothetical protein